MTRIFCVLSVALLAACGADGPPVAPAKAAAQPGISITGTAKVGIVNR